MNTSRTKAAVVGIALAGGAALALFSPASAALGFLSGGLPTVNLPTTGSGNFSGTVVGSVLNNGTSYVATGTFANNYNFGTNSGNFAVSNFDSRSFSGRVSGIPGSTGYSGQVAGSNLAGGVNGAFYGNAASTTGGNFSVASQGATTSPYSAIGVFGGSR